MPCRDMSACDFEGFLQREGARVQRFAENRGVHAQFGELLDVAQVVELGDATGCGDTYVLGYLYMRNKGASYAEAGCFAAAMSTIKLEKSGPFSGTEEEVWHILKSNKQKPEVLVAQ